MVSNQTKANHPYNAECCIDYKKKNVTFSYTQEINNKNDWMAFQNHIFSHLIGYILFLVLLIKITLNLYIPFIYVLESYYGNTGRIFIFLLVLYGLIYIGLWKVLEYSSLKTIGAISVLLHRIPAVREVYPKTNAIFHHFNHYIRNLFNWKDSYDFRDIKGKEQIRNKYIWINNKLIIFNYNIVVAEYFLYKDCAKYIKKVYTKCTAEEKEKREDINVMDFCIVFEFIKKPKKGKVEII